MFLLTLLLTLQRLHIWWTNQAGGQVRNLGGIIDPGLSFEKHVSGL